MRLQGLSEGGGAAPAEDIAAADDGRPRKRKKGEQQPAAAAPPDAIVRSTGPCSLRPRCLTVPNAPAVKSSVFLSRYANAGVASEEVSEGEAKGEGCGALNSGLSL